ncbi:SAM-dependent chlorinase/fluorinase [Flavobacterium agricola]|uniref:SAM-dependent chlorinase/fluorinase n=1 Tax=Flavobacterium agricola TaxID=2870839 RepID=A0ABY6LY09_9FLAO|nr:SAM-dependent chlorinase/fluorinase [Flavobacterium agricola]UYW01124.1 SAM-dependent chlorinase/fluorinase [Flavobacterium agricola]
MNAIITLTTDFGHKDHYVGAVKGRLLSENRDFIIVDISHDIDLFNVQEASYVIESAYANFPKGTVHVIGVDCEKTAFNRHVVMLWQDQYFIAADNGVLSFLTHKYQPEKLYEINIHHRYDEDTSAMDILLIVASHLAKGGNLDVIGRPIKALKEIIVPQANVAADNSALYGQVIYTDNYGNCITNITKNQVRDVAKGRDFYVSFGTKKIGRIHKNYSDFEVENEEVLKTREGNVLALFNSTQHLEIAIYKANPKTIGGAKSLLGLTQGSAVRVTFFEPLKKEPQF